MTTDNQPQVPGSPPAADTLWTAGTLTLIAIGAALAIMLMCWGAYLKRQRKAAEREMLDRQEDRHDGAASTPHAVAPSAGGEMAEPVASPRVETPVRPPVAPAPPPLEPGDTPVPAAAPLDASPAAMAEDAHDTPVASDDLTQLKGVGPKLAARLGELGIAHFAQLATLTPAQAGALDAQLGSFQGRMARDRWIDQARYLAANDRAGFEAEFGKL